VSSSDITLKDIYIARQRITGIVRKTPLVSSPCLSELVGSSVYLKLESLQETGSFKVRGATNKMLDLTEEQKEQGVVAASTGNHARAVAYMAQKLDIRAKICISKDVPQYRVEAIKKLGAKVILSGHSQDEAMERAFQLVEDQGMTMIHPFDDPAIIAGQGTIGLELLEQLPEIKTVLVPLSGGGLISGIALALKSADPEIRVIGVSMDTSAVMYHSLRAGEPLEMNEEYTIADALLGGIGLNNKYTFRMCQEYLDDTVLVTDDEIADGIAFALKSDHLVVEGAGAVGVAALLRRKKIEVGCKVVVIVSGGNIDLRLLLNIAREHSCRQVNRQLEGQ